MITCFYLPLALGFHRAYLLAMALNVGIGVAAYCLSLSAAPGAGMPPRQRLSPPMPVARPSAGGSRCRWSGVGLAFASGTLTLGLEVVCTRMFAQVLQNSVYTFSTILVVFLVALALGALGASLLARLTLPPSALLLALLAAAGIGVAVTPFAFFTVTDGMRYLGTSESWTLYTAAIFADSALVLLVPGILVGTVFPFLLRLEQDSGLAVGRAIGRLVAWNTAGAIAGATLTGFLLLPRLGLWGTFRLFAAIYLLLALLMYGPAVRELRPMRLAPLAGLVLLFTALDPTRLPLVRVDAAAGERLLDVWEGAHGVTAVIERRSDRRIKRDGRPPARAQSDAHSAHGASLAGLGLLPRDGNGHHGRRRAATGGAARRRDRADPRGDRRRARALRRGRQRPLRRSARADSPG